MRGADDVTKDKSKYFLITEKEKQRIIEPRYYSITVSNDLENGSVETETVSAKPDETISLTAHRRIREVLRRSFHSPAACVPN